MIAFNKYYNHFNIVSTFLIVVSLVLLIFKGLNFGIDFKGGTLIELRSTDTKINVSSLRDKDLYSKRYWLSHCIFKCVLNTQSLLTIHNLKRK